MSASASGSQADAVAAGERWYGKLKIGTPASSRSTSRLVSTDTSYGPGAGVVSTTARTGTVAARNVSSVGLMTPSRLAATTINSSPHRSASPSNVSDAVIGTSSPPAP